MARRQEEEERLMMLVQEAARAAPVITGELRLLIIAVSGLVVKAIVDISLAVIKSRQARSAAKEAKAEAELEETKAYQLSVLKGKDGNPDKTLITAFCPAHIGIVKELTTLENETKHINSNLTEIKGHVEAIRAAVGK